MSARLPQGGVTLSAPAGTRRRSRTWRALLLYAVLGVAAVITLAPLAYLALTAFKTKAGIEQAIFFSPAGTYTTANFDTLFQRVPFGRYLANSLWIAALSTLLQAFFSSLGGFALAKYRFAGKGPLMLLMLGTMMLPGPLLISPLYELIYHLGMLDSHAGLIVPGLVNVFGILLFRQAMLGVPEDLLDAARIDGCGEFRIWWSVALPLVRPMMGAFCLIGFMGQWNSFLWPQIVLQTQDRFTLPLGLSQANGVYSQDVGMMMAGTLLAILPVMALFLFLQREFISGLTSGAVKG